MLNTIKKHGIILAFSAFVATALVVFTYALTKDRIAEQKQLQKLKSLNEVISKNLHDNSLTQNCTLISDANFSLTPMPAYIATLNGKTTAIAIETIAPNGYNGEIKILLAIDNFDQIIALRVLEHNETPGLGDKVDLSVSQWVHSFVGKTLSSQEDKLWAVKKDGGLFDQFTGATITPRAVVNASRKALWYVKQNREKILAQAKNCGEN